MVTAGAITAHPSKVWEVRSRAVQVLRAKQTENASAMTRATSMPLGALGPEAKVLYGVFTSASSQYRAKLEAQMETWAKPLIADGRFIAIGGRDYRAELLVPGVVESADCNDKWPGLSCKEAHLIAEGAKRGVDWIFVIGEDNYVDSALLEQKLRSFSPNEFLGLGCIGCGTGHSEYGSEINAKGSFCGGCGYALSRTTMSKLTEKGVDSLISEYGGPDYQSMPNDMNTGKAMRVRGAQLKQFPGPLEGNPSFSKKSFQTKLHDNTVVYHYLSPEQMRWLYAVKSNAAQDVVEQLEKKTFDQVGCALGLESTFWASQGVDCRARNGNYP